MKNTYQKKIKVKDIQKQLMLIAIRNNPKCTVGEFSKNYTNMVRYFKGNNDDIH